MLLLIRSWELLLIELEPGGDPEQLQLGFPFAVALLAIVGVIALFGCFAWTRERYYPDEELQQSGSSRTNLFDDLGGMLRNSQWIIAALAMFIIQIRGGLQGGAKSYFVKYYIDQDLTGFSAL